MAFFLFYLYFLFYFFFFSFFWVLSQRSISEEKKDCPGVLYFKLSSPRNEIMPKKRYEMSIEEGVNGNFIKFIVTPNGYHRKISINFVIILLSNLISNYLVNRYLGITGEKKLLFLCTTFLTSVFMIRNPTIESFYVLKNYGIQISQTKGIIVFPPFLNAALLEQKQFIPNDMVVDIIINEGFYKGFQVVFYLAVIIKNSKRLQLIFPVCLTIKKAQQLN